MSNNKHKLEELISVLRKFGIDGDPDWVAVVLFVRNLVSRLSVYTDDKKAEIQALIFTELAKQEFSAEHFEVIIAMLESFVMQSIGALELEEALASEKRSATCLINEMDDILNSMSGVNERQTRRLDAFKEHTVGIIQSDADRSVIVAKVRTMFTGLIQEFKEEARELQERAKMLERTANFDPLLTELHNRRALDAYLNEMTRLNVEKGGGVLTMMMIDVDHFKKVNDTYGHQAGDDVLRAMARILSVHAVQYNGFTARYGGEELVVVAQNVPLNISVLKAEAIRKNVEEYAFRIHTDGHLAKTPLNITVSIGVSEWQPGWDSGMLVSAADQALYVAKGSGRNQVRAYDPNAC